jgi:hypothetical protein
MTTTNPDALTDTSWRPKTRSTYWVDGAALQAIKSIRDHLLAEGLSHSASDAVRFALVHTSRKLGDAPAAR